MKKHIAPLLCAVLLLGTSTTAVLADCPPDDVRLDRATAEAAGGAGPTSSGPYYPISVEEYAEAGETRIRKVYQLSLSDDPSLIPTGSFTRDGRTYQLLDITQKDEVGVDTKAYSEGITQDSDTGELSEILKVLPAQKKVTTKDGYTGTLLLDHASIDISVKGYQTSSRNLSATRTYPSLSDTDLSLVPKSVSSGGASLTLADVQWSNDGSYYTATATYTGTATSRYATGYTVKANYTGQVARTGCEVVTYTAVYGSEPPLPEASTVENIEPEEAVKEGTETEDHPEGAAVEDGPEDGHEAEHSDTRRKQADGTVDAAADVPQDTATVDPETLARENAIMASICAVSGIFGILGIALMLLQYLRGRKEGGQKQR